MDATTNDMPLSVEYTVKGFPTILFFRAKDNVLLEYSSSDREAMDFYKFLKENAHYKDELKIDESVLKQQEHASEEDAEQDGEQEEEEEAVVPDDEEEEEKEEL